MAEAATATETVLDAYVDQDDRVLDPTILDQSVLDRMPQPTGWRMLVLPYGGKVKSKGGILLTQETLDKEALATVVAYVVKQGPLCYGDKNKYPIKHIIVLMEENRSFDHMLGWMTKGEKYEIE